MKRSFHGAMRSRSMWFSTLLMIIGGLETYYPNLERVIKPEYYGPILFGIGMVGVVLRSITEKPLDDR